MTKRMKFFGSFFILCTWCSTGVLCNMFSILGLSPSSSEPKSSFQGSKADICNITINKVHQKCMCSVLSDTVDCSHMEIEELPLDIKFPKTRRIVSFRGNEIGVIQENTFYNGREVLDLDISNNQIDFISVNAFKAFETLIYLKMGHNRIWSVPLNVFEGLKNLLTLDLSHNELISLDPDIFKPLTNLKELRLKSNPLEHFEPQEFKHLQNLELLDLEATLLSIVPDEMFMFLTKLKFLSLANNRLFEVPTAALQSLNHLKVLDLSGNPIETIPAQAFFGLNKLSILYLDRMPLLSSIEEHAFADIKNLKELHCSYNFVLAEIHEDAFRDEKTKEVVAVDQLFLRQNDLCSIPEHLLQWTSSVELDIRENSLYCDCHAKWLLHLKLKTNFQNHVRCSSPNHLKDRLLSELNESEMICGLPSHMIIIVSCAVAVGILIVMLIIALFVWRRAYSGYRNVYYRVSKKQTSDDIVYQKGDDP